MDKTGTSFAIFAGVIAVAALALFLRIVDRNKTIEDANERLEQQHFQSSRHAAHDKRFEPMALDPTGGALPRSAQNLPSHLPIPDHYRCISGQLFHVLPNEVAQVTDGSASTYCR